MGCKVQIGMVWGGDVQTLIGSRTFQPQTSRPQGPFHYKLFNPIGVQCICYSHWTNGARNWVISIGQQGVFNYEKGAI